MYLTDYSTTDFNGGLMADQCIWKLMRWQIMAQAFCLMRKVNCVSGLYHTAQNEKKPSHSLASIDVDN
jgi:hypothetical protein